MKKTYGAVVLFLDVVSRAGITADFLVSSFMSVQLNRQFGFAKNRVTYYHN